MAAGSTPHFQNSMGLASIEVGAKEFMCIGALPPFDHPHVIAGQGTIAVEILRQCQGPIDAIFVAIGGGGLISGIASYVKRVRPEIKVIGVQPVD